MVETATKHTPTTPSGTEATVQASGVCIMCYRAISDRSPVLMQMHGHFVPTSVTVSAPSAPETLTQSVGVPFLLLPSARPPQPHRCCFTETDAPNFWDASIQLAPLPSGKPRTALVANVQQMDAGGDAVVLDSEYSDWIQKARLQREDGFTFRTSILKSGCDAALAIRKYFPSLYAYGEHNEHAGDDWIVCVGHMTLKLEANSFLSSSA
ncbi:hypothetical protein BC830DRAFT_1127937 [Chytriomyces sp. MP71]|nr:hypothetical protein BC830DRAFT_1127937 [Chytriomyces sp. MP71]